jgi:dTDP-4-amino-4,6-dideoxygalactose transaminase
VVEVLKSGWITTGPKTKLFEKKIAEYCGTNKAVCLNSATACMELTLKLFGIGEGDEVITSAYTYTASASVIQHVGAKIVLVDTAPNSYHLDYTQLTKAITNKTKAIISVDIAGVMCDYDKINEVVKSKRQIFSPSNEMQKALGRILVIADAAHSFGATYKGEVSGSVADFSCFSFHAVKNLTTAEGSAVVWKDNNNFDDEWIYKQFMLMSLHGQSKDALAKTQIGSWEYDIVDTFYKCNMTDIMAGIGLAQLERYTEILQKRERALELYKNNFKNSIVEIIEYNNSKINSSGHLCLTRIKGIDENKWNQIIVEMAKKGVPTNVHYKPLPMHTAYKKLGFDIKDFSNAYNQYKNEITLPLHSLLKEEDINYISATLLEIVNGL